MYNTILLNQNETKVQNKTILKCLFIFIEQNKTIKKLYFVSLSRAIIIILYYFLCLTTGAASGRTA